MVEPDNYTELLQAIKMIAKYCDKTACNDCAFFNANKQCRLKVFSPWEWLFLLPENERSEQQ